MHLGQQGHGQFDHLLHALLEQLGGALRLLGGTLQQQLVVHLQDQPAAEVLPAQGLIHPHHGQLDDVRCRALDRGVHGGALAELADGALGGGKLGQVAPPAHEGNGIAVVLPVLCGGIHEALHPGILGEIPADELPGLLGGHAGVPRQAEAADAVDQAEVDCLGPGAQGGGHLRKGHVENLAGSAGMHILPGAEGLHQRRVAGEMGHQPQFDLAVIRIQQYPALPGQEGPADLLSLLGADGDILQIRFGGGNAPGGGGYLIKVGMHPALCVGQAKKALHIGGIQLGQLAVAQKRVDDFRGNVPQALQHLGGGGIAPLGLFAVGQLQLVEEHLAQLLGAVQVEGRGVAGGKHLLLCFFNILHIALAQFPQEGGVHREARLLHAEQGDG